MTNSYHTYSRNLQIIPIKKGIKTKIIHYIILNIQKPQSIFLLSKKNYSFANLFTEM